MVNWRPYTLLLCFGIQALVNLAFYGMPAIMLSTAVPEGATNAVTLLLPLAVFGYFAIGTASLYYLGISTQSLQKGRILGGAYFLIGLLGSTGVLLKLEGTETPLLPLMMGLWAGTSLIGVIILAGGGVGLPTGTSAVVGFLLFLSGLISASTAQWVAKDSSSCFNMVNNGTVTTGRPVRMPSPNSSG